MKFAIMESIITEGGHEIDYDRILVEECKKAGHEIEFYVPEGHTFKWNYGAPVHFLSGSGVSYKGVRGLKKLCLSAKREWNRQGWYRQMAKLSEQKLFDALIFPSATYRYLRALQWSPLQHAQKPVIFIIHGLTPAEAPLLFKEAEKCLDNPNIKIVVQTFAKDELSRGKQLANIFYVYPPNYIPRDIEMKPSGSKPEVFKFGFFGQYRREKNVDGFLEQLVQCEVTHPFKLIVQGATNTKQDAEDFARIIEKYKKYPYLEFWHRPLIGKEWQQAFADMDAIIMPYGAERYKYHTSAILSTAIGFQKAVFMADTINPEVLQEYKIGMSFNIDSPEDLRKQWQLFISSFAERYKSYHEHLQQAGQAYAPERLIAALAELAAENR